MQPNEVKKLGKKKLDEKVILTSKTTSNFHMYLLFGTSFSPVLPQVL